MRLLVTGDWHLDAVVRGYDFFDDLVERLTEISNLAKSQNVDTLFFLGDLANPDRGWRTLRAIKTLAAFSHHFHKVFTLCGNHDWLGRKGIESTLDVFTDKQQKFFHIATPGDSKKLPKGFFALPWVPSSVYKNVYGSELITANHHFLFSHLDLHGIGYSQGSEEEMLRGGAVPFPSAYLQASSLSHVFAGHIHNHQRVGKKITVVGSLERFTKAEAQSEKGVIILDTETGQQEFYPVSARSCKLLTLNLTQTSVKEWLSTLPKVSGARIYLEIQHGEGQKLHLDIIRDSLLEAGAHFFHLPTFVLQKEKREGRKNIVIKKSYSVEDALQKWEETYPPPKKAAPPKELLKKLSL